MYVPGYRYIGRVLLPHSASVRRQYRTWPGGKSQGRPCSHGQLGKIKMSIKVGKYYNYITILERVFKEWVEQFRPFFDVFCVSVRVNTDFIAGNVTP